MSDSTKTILWIALAVVVVALVIVAVVRSSRKRRVLDERRFKAGELRAEAEQKVPLLQESADRASVTERIAADARVEADEKAAAAAALEDQAQVNRAQADGVRAERDDLAREADRIDPDVKTDDDGHRVGEDSDDSNGIAEVPDSETQPDSEVELHPQHATLPTASVTTPDEPSNGGRPPATASHSEKEAVTATGVLGGASTLDDPDDEPDLADAKDPFATAGDEAAVAGYDEDMKKKKRTAKTKSSGSTAVPTEASTADAAADETGRAAAAKADDVVDVVDVVDVADGPSTDQSDPVTDDDARKHPVTGDAGPVDDATQAAGGLGAKHQETRDEAGAANGASTGDRPQVATAMQPTKVAVPALDDRDDVLVAGGPPDNDPGDHRGQPWATTPGEPGLDEGDDVADNTDEGFAAHTPAEAAPDQSADRDRNTNGDSAAETAPDGDSEPEQDADSSTTDDVDRPAVEVERDHSNESNDSDDSDAQPPVVAAAAPSAGSAAGASESSSTKASEGWSENQTAPEAGHDAAPVADNQSKAERRVSGFEEVVDGGYGIGSARPIDGGAQPLGHPVKAWNDRKSFSAPGDEGYDGAEPDVWFYNEDAARRAGFSRGSH